jgi:putative holliday junction resolvase
MSRTLLAFDYGTQRIGVAIGQEITATARVLTTLKARNGIPDWQQVSQLITTWQPQLLVIGLPLTMEGEEQPITLAARRFGNRLAGRYNLPVIAVDERLTSQEARINRRHAGQRSDGPVDAEAARLILQSWLDSHSTPERAPQ